MHPIDDDSGSFHKSKVTPRMTRSMQQRQLKECLPTEAKCANLKTSQEGGTPLTRGPKPSSEKKWDNKASYNGKWTSILWQKFERTKKECSGMTPKEAKPSGFDSEEDAPTRK